MLSQIDSQLEPGLQIDKVIQVALPLVAHYANSLGRLTGQVLWFSGDEQELKKCLYKIQILMIHPNTYCWTCLTRSIFTVIVPGIILRAKWLMVLEKQINLERPKVEASNEVLPLDLEFSSLKDYFIISIKFTLL